MGVVLLQEICGLIPLRTEIHNYSSSEICHLIQQLSFVCIFNVVSFLIRFT